MDAMHPLSIKGDYNNQDSALKTAWRPFEFNC